LDKAEYKIATEHIKKLISQGEYAEASHIADTIDWRRVKSVMMLCTVSDLYKVNRRYEDAKDLLYMAYERNPESRTILYSLCDLSIKLEEFVAAIEYYKSFVEVAPKDTGRYVLQYRLYQAQDVSLEERIEVLEQLKSEEYVEKWAYELAYLYHRIGFATKCVEECDELILWFGKGRYVYKAMELKMLHEPLTPSQQHIYDSRFEQVEQAKDMTRVLPRIDSGDSEMTDGSMVDVTDAPTVEIPKEYIEKELHTEPEEIQVKTLDVANAYNTMNLQKELADSLREILEISQTESSVDESTQAKDEETFSEDEESFSEEIVIEKVTPTTPEEALVNDQITGQLTIDDILAGWDKQEEQAAEAHEEAISNHIKSQTQDIFAAIEAEMKKDILEVSVETESEELEEEELTEEEFTEAENESEDIEEEPCEEEQPEEAQSEQEAPAEEEPVEVLEKEEPAEAAEPQDDMSIYADFIRSKDTVSQIKAAKEQASMDPTVGNICVTGHDLSICFDFIKVIMADLKCQGFAPEGKTAKISAVNLNKKEPSELIGKVEGGILIIERVGRLRKDTVTKIQKCLESEISSVLVFATDTDQGMNRFVERFPSLAKLFQLRVDIKDYSGEELVAYATKYAYEQEYSIEMMGTLALRTRIEQMIANDDSPSMDDAKSIVDEAIEHANRKNFKHFMDILLHKRYDEEDMIVLKEEDFLY